MEAIGWIRFKAKKMRKKGYADWNPECVNKYSRILDRSKQTACATGPWVLGWRWTWSFPSKNYIKHHVASHFIYFPSFFLLQTHSSCLQNLVQLQSLSSPFLSVSNHLNKHSYSKFFFSWPVWNKDTRSLLFLRKESRQWKKRKNHASNLHTLQWKQWNPRRWSSPLKHPSSLSSSPWCPATPWPTAEVREVSKPAPGKACSDASDPLLAIARVKEASTSQPLEVTSLASNPSMVTARARVVLMSTLSMGYLIASSPSRPTQPLHLWKEHGIPCHSTVVDVFRDGGTRTMAFLCVSIMPLFSFPIISFSPSFLTSLLAINFFSSLCPWHK